MGRWQRFARCSILENLGLPAIDEGVIAGRDATRRRRREARRRAAMHASRLQDRVSATGTRYRAGPRDRAIPRRPRRWRDRQAAMRAASRTAAIGARPSYADFDIVRIDPDEDAEAAAHAFCAAARGASTRRPRTAFTRMFKPNDPLYSTPQWNLPLINMEKAWDIQPQAGSAITVAVIDTGMAYQNATITATLPAFSDDERRHVSGARQGDDSVRRGAAAGRRRQRRPHRRAVRFHLRTRRRRSTSTATARTSAAPSAS